MDGAHLKGEYKGTILHAVSMDGDNKILPVGYGICRSETLASWSWFLENLHECIGDLDNLCFISDRLPAIESAVKNVFPKSHHVICNFHLAQNLTAHFRKNKRRDSAFWEMVKDYKTRDFDSHFQRFRARWPNVGVYLGAIPREKWTRSYSHGMRYNCMTSNSAESMNSVSKDARRMPVTTLLEFFRAITQKWFYQRTKAAGASQVLLTKWAEDKIKKKFEKARGWRVCAITDARYEVNESKSKEVVDFSTSTCTCRKWQLSGLPCGHVSVVVDFLKQSNTAHLAISNFHIQTYRQMYEEYVNPLPAEKDWEVPNENQIVNAPIMEIRQAGRPRNNDRIPSQGEGPIIRRCSRCGQTGHTRNRCTSTTPVNKYKNPGRSTTRMNIMTENMNGASGSGTQSERFVIPTISLDFDLNNLPV